MKVKSFLLQASFLTMSAFIISGCGGSSSQSSSALGATQGIQSIDVTTVLARSTTSSVQTHVTLDTSLKNVPINYYLLSSEAEQVVTGDTEDNSTTKSIPKEQYNVGTAVLDVEGGDSVIDSNITIGNNIPVGNYRLAAHINPLNVSAYKDGDIYIGNDILEVKASATDIVLQSLTLDDDVFLVDDLENDTMILSTLRAQSITGQVKNVNVQACLEFNSKCTPLEFLVDGNISQTREILSLDEIVSNISTMLVISKELKGELYSQLDANVHDAFIQITLTPKDDEVNVENNTVKTRLSLYKLDTKRVLSRAVAGSQVVFKNFSKGFDASKNDSLFGITFGAGAEGNFGSLYSDAGVNGLLAVKVLGAGFTLLSVDATAIVQYDSFENTGYDVLIKSLGMNIYSNAKTLAEMAEYDTLEEAKLEDNETSLPKAEQDKILAARQAEINVETKSALSYTKEFSYEKDISKEQTIMVGVVPVVVKAGAIGTLGFDGTIALEGILLLHSEMGPTASLAGFASGGVGIQGFSAGVEASFTFIENDFRGVSEFEFVFSGDSKDLRLKGILSEQVVNTFGGPNGSVDLYAEYTEPKICEHEDSICVSYKLHKGKIRCKSHKTIREYYPCGIKTNRPTLNIFKWDSGLSRDITLLNESQTLLDIKLY